MSKAGRGRAVVFRRETAAAHRTSAEVVGLRFTINPQAGGAALVDFRPLRPRSLALACAKALRSLAAPGGTLSVRTSVMAYANSIRRFFRYLDADARISRPEDLRSAHIDGFENWMEGHGLSRIHLFTVLVKVIATLREIVSDSPEVFCEELRDRLSYVSSKPFERSAPRDAYSPFVAQALRQAARADVENLFRRLTTSHHTEVDASLQRASKAVDAVIQVKGTIRHDHPLYKSLFFMRARRQLGVSTLITLLHGRHYLLASDLTPLLVLLSLETGLELECCKALTIDCLRNASGGTVEITYLKRRAHGAEHKTLHVRDGGAGTPGGLIRRLIDATARARSFSGGDSLWVYFCTGRLRAGAKHSQEHVDAWVAKHRLVDDGGKPLRLLLSRLRKTHKALWYRKTEGHMARFAVGHTAEVAARYYADIPSLAPLHEAAVEDGLQDALNAAHSPVILTPRQEAQRGQTVQSIGASGIAVGTPNADGQDVWLASCSGFYRSPFGAAGEPCPQPFWGCLECGNAVITARKLPAILSFLDFICTQRAGLSEDDWKAKFCRVHARITTQVLPKFSRAVIAAARQTATTSGLAMYLPPEAVA